MYSFPLFLLLNKFIKLYTPALNELGLTYAQVLTMICLWKQDGQKVTAIGRTLRFDTGTLTPILTKLEAAGHIERRRGDEDKRIVRVFVTEQGRELHAKAKERFQCLSVYGVSVGCSKKELDQLREMAKSILDRFDRLPDSVRDKVQR